MESSNQLIQNFAKNIKPINKIAVEADKKCPSNNTTIIKFLCVFIEKKGKFFTQNRAPINCKIESKT